MDIQEKVFRSQPGLHGYNEREVDEFLDRITEEMARVHAENQRLREQLAGKEPAPRSVTAAAAAGPQIGGDYIASEKEFLRSLATLIQNHAQAVRRGRSPRGGVRSGASAPARAAGLEHAAPPAPVAAAAPSPRRRRRSRPWTRPARLDPGARRRGAGAAGRDDPRAVLGRGLTQAPEGRCARPRAPASSGRGTGSPRSARRSSRRPARGSRSRCRARPARSASTRTRCSSPGAATRSGR